MPSTEHASNHSASRPSRRWITGGFAGLLAGAAAVAVSEAVTALLTGVTSPLLAVGNRAVDWAPRPLKEFAIEQFGTRDKPVLIGGVLATVLLGAVVIYEWPAVQAVLLASTRAQIGGSSGPLAVAGRAYGSGSILRAAVVTFLINFLLGSITVISLPSVVLGTAATGTLPR